MKKSKILMPLTGIAAIGAIAPVAVMTSCNKGQNQGNFLKHASIGMVYDYVNETTYSLTNRLGAEDFTTGGTYSVNKLTIGVTLNDGFDVTHTIKVSADAQGSASQVLNVVSFKDYKPTATQLSKGTWFQEITDLFTVNKTVYDKLVTDKAEEKFDFNLKYTECDKDGKELKTQVVPYTIYVCPTQHKLPALGTWAITATQEGEAASPSKNVNIAIPAFLSEGAGTTLNVKWETPVELVKGENTLTIAAQTGVIDEEATWDEYIKATTITAINADTEFTIKAATDVVISFKEVIEEGEKQYYVLPEFTLTAALPATTKIKVTAAA